jgi:hypothetical protein
MVLECICLPLLSRWCDRPPSGIPTKRVLGKQVIQTEGDLVDTSDDFCDNAVVNILIFSVPSPICEVYRGRRAWWFPVLQISEQLERVHHSEGGSFFFFFIHDRSFGEVDYLILLHRAIGMYQYGQRPQRDRRVQEQRLQNQHRIHIQWLPEDNDKRAELEACDQGAVQGKRIRV